MRRLLSLVILIALLIGQAPIAPAQAQDAPALAAIGTPAPIPGFTVSRDEATANFPQGITFALEAASDTPIAEVALLYHVPGIETLSVELPAFPAGEKTLAIEHPVSLDAGELPPGLDVIYHWRITDADGNVTETAEQTIPWIDSRYEWKPLEGPRVTVYAYDMSPDFQQATLDAAEETVDNLVEAYGFAPTQHIRIWAYANQEDLYGALAPNSEPWIAGSAYPPLHLIMAILPPGDYDELARVIPHEMTHQVAYQVTENPFNTPPLWFNEGLAVYWQKSGRDRMYTYALHIADQGELPPLRTLNGEFDYNPEGALISYSLSMSVVVYILDTWGDEGMANLLSAFREGVTYDEAIEQGLGVTFDELDQGWREDLKAKAERLLASGSTRFGDDPVDPTAGTSLWDDLLVSSGTLMLGMALLIALVAGGISFWRSRRHQDEEEDDDLTYGPQWREWPEGLDPPGWQAQVPSRP